MIDTLVNEFAASPNVLIHDLDVVHDRAALIKLSDQEMLAASFLDGRIVTPQTVGGWTDWADLEKTAAAMAPHAPAMIFHVGHCGSTLISRLIEAASGVRALREPQALRRFAAVFADLDDGVSIWRKRLAKDRLAMFLRSCSKGVPTAVKATSMCGGLIDDAFAAGVERALFIYVGAETYIAAMLGGANTPIDLRNHAALRLRRLRHICDDEIGELQSMSLADIAAMSWACEAASAAAAPEDRLKPVDFDEFLTAPAVSLEAAVRHLHPNVRQLKIDETLKSPLMSRYSKAPEHPFSPSDRAQLLKEYRREHRQAIADSMRWLEKAAARHAPVRKAMDKFSA